MIGCNEFKASVWPDEERGGWMNGAALPSTLESRHLSTHPSVGPSVWLYKHLTLCAGFSDVSVEKDRARQKGRSGGQKRRKKRKERKECPSGSRRDLMSAVGAVIAAAAG